MPRVERCQPTRTELRAPGTRAVLQSIRVAPGKSVIFRVVGPDAQTAILVIRETFKKGLVGHLAAVRKYVRRKAAQLEGTRGEGGR